MSVVVNTIGCNHTNTMVNEISLGRPSSHITAVFTVWNSCSIGLFLIYQTRLFQVSLIYSLCSSVRDCFSKL